MELLEKILRFNDDFLRGVSNISSQAIQVREEANQEIVNYHPLTNGHMLRPLLVNITASSFGEEFSEEKKTKLQYFASAVELMHNASLLHDDLLDKEEVRRGKPCLYKKYGFKNGLLVGNIYYIKAIELSNDHLAYEQTSDLLKSAIAMCEGEILQAGYDEKEISEEIYDRIIRYKTGSLTALACRQAANIMGADPQLTLMFGELGEELGVMYQLRDDCKDSDVRLDGQFEYERRMQVCSDKIQELLENLSATNQCRGFEELIHYLYPFRAKQL